MTIYYTTGYIEKAWALPKGSVRRDIHRGKIDAQKSGNAWLIDHEEAERLYGPRPLDCFYRYDEMPSQVLFFVDMDEAQSTWASLSASFYPEPFVTWDEFRGKCELIWVSDIVGDDDLLHDLEYYSELLHPTIRRVVGEIGAG